MHSANFFVYTTGKKTHFILFHCHLLRIVKLFIPFTNYTLSVITLPYTPRNPHTKSFFHSKYATALLSRIESRSKKKPGGMPFIDRSKRHQKRRRGAILYCTIGRTARKNKTRRLVGWVLYNINIFFAQVEYWIGERKIPLCHDGFWKFVQFQHF